MQFAVDAPLDFRNRLIGVLRLRQIDLNVILGSSLPGTILRERVARAGDDAPAGSRKALDGGVANAAACSGEEKGATRLIAIRHSRCPLRIEPRLAPRRVRMLAPKRNPVMQAERTLLPKLDLLRYHAITRPVRRPRYGPDAEFCGKTRDRFLERQAAFKCSGLIAGPCTDLRHARARGEIRISFLGRHRLDNAAQPDLTLQRLPVKRQRRFWRVRQLAALHAVQVGVEDEAVLVEALQ